MNTFPPREIVERLRLQYPAGCRVELVSMDDPYARLRPGDQGTVTIHKDGQDFTFKTEASVLRRDCTNTYGTWYIVAADRREFERRFGRSAEYAPGEIVRITYARKVLYEAEN